MFFKKKAKDDKDQAKQPQDLSVRLDSLETESVREQLREIEKQKGQAKDTDKDKAKGQQTS